jgi:4'-phosphopantetheinyl transferase
MFKVVILMVIPELALCEYDSLFQYVSYEKQECVKRFRDFQDAQNCLLGDILARIEICCAMNFSNKQLEFATNSYGKPYLTNSANIHYNISHAGYYVTCVISDEPVGIDIECVKPVDIQVADRFFSQNELAYVLSSSNDLWIQRFFEIWTKKESRIKWEGKGLSKDLPTFSVLDSSKTSQVFYHQVYKNETTVCHVCSNKQEAPTVKIINTNTLLKQINLLDKI